MIIVIGVILIALLFGVLGVIVEGLLWLLFIGIALAVGAFIFGAVRGRASGSP